MEDLDDQPFEFRAVQPLEIQCITQQIIKFLPHTDLKKARLVSHAFNEEASRILRRKSKIVLNSPKRLIAFYLEKFESVDKFCECFQLINVHVATPSMKMLFETFGPKVKSLDLRDSKWTCEELESILTDTMLSIEELVVHGVIPKDATRLFHQQQESFNNPPDNSISIANAARPVPKLPKIKKLDLQLYDKSPEEDPLKQFVIDILSSAYNLEVLKSSDAGKWRNRRERFHRILFELLIDPDVKLQILKLRKVDFDITPWGEDQIQRLIGKKFPLGYLNLTILPVISITAVVSLLISLRNTLTKLKLSFTYWTLTEFPCDMNLHKLNHLSLDWFNGSLAFVTHLKSLQTLILAQVNLNDMFTPDEVAKFLKPHKLSRLEVYQHSGAVVLPTTVNLISDVFPHVTKLVLGKLNDESLGVVFTRFPLLEEFSAIEGAFSDFGITGIDIKPCNICKRKHLNDLSKPNRQLYNEDLVNQQRNHAFIGDLKNLWKLELKSAHMTNLSVIHGIAYCQRLRSLSLWCCELTFRSLKKLVDTFSFEYLETTLTFTHRNEIRYALSKMTEGTLILNGLLAPRSLSLISQEVQAFLNQFNEIICRSMINNMTRPQFQQQHLLLVYEACMAEQTAMQGLIHL